ncbi:MAG: DUF5678 domain-containing protein [Patescibacteria group bacterium]
MTNNHFSLKQLKEHENKWIVIELDKNEIVGSGEDASEAKKEAERKGYKNTILMKVFPFRMGYIPYSL